MEQEKPKGKLQDITKKTPEIVEDDQGEDYLLNKLERDHELSFRYENVK